MIESQRRLSSMIFFFDMPERGVAIDTGGGGAAGVRRRLERSPFLGFMWTTTPLAMSGSEAGLRGGL
jgi:hypothetical protein